MSYVGAFRGCTWGFCPVCEGIDHAICMVNAVALWDNISRYIPYILITWIFVELYINYNTNYHITRYEFYPIIILILLKIFLQIYYSKGPIYKPKIEIPRETISILQEIFGYHIGYTIKTFLPIFYDKDRCDEKYLINDNDVCTDDVKDNSHNNDVELALLATSS